MMIECPTLGATEALGRRLGALLFPGAVVALIGPMGAGKTHLTKAIAAGLGISDTRVVNSPTFVLIQEYQARMPIYHFDTYRLRSEADFLDLGVHEYFEGDGVCVVEWADRFPNTLPREFLRVKIEIVGEFARRFHVSGQGSAYEDLINRWNLADSGTPKISANP